jgi:hypothetical protein
MNSRDALSTSPSTRTPHGGGHLAEIFKRAPLPAAVAWRLKIFESATARRSCENAVRERRARVSHRFGVEPRPVGILPGFFPRSGSPLMALALSVVRGPLPDRDLDAIRCDLRAPGMRATRSAAFLATLFNENTVRIFRCTPSFGDGNEVVGPYAEIPIRVQARGATVMSGKGEALFLAESSPEDRGFRHPAARLCPRSRS